MKLGQKVSFNKYLKRKETFEGNRTYKRFWSVHAMKNPINGIIVGIRILSSGHVFYTDEGISYTSDEYHKAALVYFNLHRNPKLVLLSDLTIKTD